VLIAVKKENTLVVPDSLIHWSKVHG